MSTSLPAPPYGLEVDLSAYDWFPLHYKRLQESEWWVAASDLARSRNVDLWAQAYQEVPAASLPDSDAKLAGYAGFGRDIAGFRAVKQEILAAWILHADGRWYHPTLVKVAREAWAIKQGETLEKQRDAARKRETRATARASRQPRGVASGGHPVDVQRTSDGRQTDTEALSDGREIPPTPPLNNPTTGQEEPPTPLGRGTRTSDGPGFEGFESTASRAWSNLPVDARAASSPALFAAAFDAVLPAVLARGNSEEDLVSAAASMAKHYALGDRHRRTPSAHRWLNRGSYETFLPKPAPTPWAGPADIRAEVVAAVGADGEVFARLYLDRCSGWQDLPEPTVLCSTGHVVQRLSRGPAAAVFRRHNIAIVRKEAAA